MGGIADYTGALVCQGTLDRAAAVALALRPDRDLQVFSFNLYDAHQPFTFRIPFDRLADSTIDQLRANFNQDPNRRWAGYLAGCLFVLHEANLIDLRDPRHSGLDLALLSTIPLGAGVSSSAAIEVATMINLRDHFGLADQLDPMRLAALCQRVENHVVGAPCGIMDQVASALGREGALLKLLCQPHELQGFLHLPAGTRVVGIDTGVRHSVAAGQYGRTRCAAFMGHTVILAKMHDMGRAAGMRLVADPTRGYLANLSLDDYRKYFRPYLPVAINGAEFLSKFGPTADPATTVDPSADYPVQSATDHHVHESQRVKNFVRFLDEAATLPPDSPARTLALDKAGHLMYASHISYTKDAQLGAPEADLLVDLVRASEPHGLYGAKITGAGQGGTVAILANASDRAATTLNDIATEYHQRTGQTPTLFTGTSPGAIDFGTHLLPLR
jgi:L-arabinokinase